MQLCHRVPLTTLLRPGVTDKDRDLRMLAIALCKDPLNCQKCTLGIHTYEQQQEQEMQLVK